MSEPPAAEPPASSPPAVCYRHPERTTRLSCSACGNPICVECTHRASVGQLCPDCVAERGNQTTYTREDLGPGATRRRSPATVTLVVVNVAIFLVGVLVAPVGNLLFGLGAQHNPSVADGQVWRLATSMFLHAGIPHILFNMYALWLFGGQLEREVGTKSFLSLYAASGLAGGSLFYLLNLASPQPAVGASGAIFGLFGAWLVAAYRNRHSPGGRAGLQQLLLLLGINLALPLFIPNIAWEAHLGGLVAGGLVTALWTTGDLRRHPGRRVLIGVAVALAAVAAVVGM